MTEFQSPAFEATFSGEVGVAVALANCGLDTVYDRVGSSVCESWASDFDWPAIFASPFHR